MVVPSPATSDVLLATSLTICAPMFSSASFKVDLLGDGHAVLGDRGRTELLIEDDVAPPGAERHLDGIAETVDPAENRLPRRIAVGDLISH